MAAQIVFWVCTIILATTNGRATLGIATTGSLMGIQVVHRSEASFTFVARILQICSVGFHVHYDIVSHAELPLAYIAFVFTFVVTLYVNGQASSVGKSFTTNVTLRRTVLMSISQMRVQ